MCSKQHGVTSLHLASAVHNDHTVFVVDALLQAGAAVNRKSNPEMDTALTVAVAHLDPPDVEDVALLLLKKNADVSCRNQVAPELRRREIARPRTRAGT